MVCFLQCIAKVQPTGPYYLVGYSFGACVAFEMALQLEQSGHIVSLILVDGSHSYVAAHTGSYRARNTLDKAGEQADALTYFVQLFKDVDFQKVILFYFHNFNTANSSRVYLCFVHSVLGTDYNITCVG